MDSEVCDVIIIGGGPAGSAAALQLAQAGHSVIQLERREFFAPQHDPLRSGEGLPPRTCRALAVLGLETDSPPWQIATTRHVEVLWPHGVQTHNDLGTQSIRLINREALDAALFAHACAHGVDGRTGWRVRDFQQDASGHVRGVVAYAPNEATPRHLRASIVIDAGGRNALALRTLARRQDDATNNFHALAMFFDQVPGLAPDTWQMQLCAKPDFLVLQLSQFCEGVVRCGLGTTQALQQRGPADPADFFWWCLQEHPELRQRFATSQVVRRPYVRAQIGYHVPQVTFDGLLLIGDATGYVNPLFGDGILRALATAAAAAKTVILALERGDSTRRAFAAYEQRQATRRRLDQVLGSALDQGSAHLSAFARLGQTATVRRAVFAALMRT